MSEHTKSASPISKPLAKFLAKSLGAGAAQAAVYDRMAYGTYGNGSWNEKRILNGLFNLGIGSAGAGLAFKGKPGGVPLMLSAPAKDVMLAAQRPLHELPGVLDKFVDQGEQAQVSSSRNRDLAMLLGVAGLGGAAYGGKKLLDRMKERRDPDGIEQTRLQPENGGTVRITLPTKSPGDAETVVELPMATIKLPKSIAGKIRRDIRRKLRTEVNERTHRRDPETGVVEPYDYEMLPKTAVSNQHPLGRVHEAIIPIRISTAKEQWQEKKKESEQLKMDELRNQTAQQKLEREAEEAGVQQPGTAPVGKPDGVSPILKKRIAEIGKRVHKIQGFKVADWKAPATNKGMGSYADRQRAHYAGSGWDYNAGIMDGLEDNFSDDASLTDSLKGDVTLGWRKAQRGTQKLIEQGINAGGGRMGAALNNLNQSKAMASGDWTNMMSDPTGRNIGRAFQSGGRVLGDAVGAIGGAIDPFAQWFSWGMAPRLGPGQSRQARFREGMSKYKTRYDGGAKPPTWGKITYTPKADRGAA